MNAILKSVALSMLLKLRGIEWKKAEHDFGGHRDAAIRACDAAIEQLRLALEYDR